MFRDRTERTLFRAGTVPETVPVRSLKVYIWLYATWFRQKGYVLSINSAYVINEYTPDSITA